MIYPHFKEEQQTLTDLMIIAKELGDLERSKELFHSLYTSHYDEYIFDINDYKNLNQLYENTKNKRLKKVFEKRIKRYRRKIVLDIKILNNLLKADGFKFD